MRDMSKAQFEAALKRHGMKHAGFMGYVELGIEGSRLSVCRFNAGKNLRAQLAYLIQKKEDEQERLAILAELTPKSPEPVSDEQRERNAAKMRETTQALNKFFFGSRA